MEVKEEAKQIRDRILATLIKDWGNQDKKRKIELEKLIDVTLTLDDSQNLE